VALRRDIYLLIDSTGTDKLPMTNQLTLKSQNALLPTSRFCLSQRKRLAPDKLVHWGVCVVGGGERGLNL